MSNKQYLVFTLGPVQGFVAQSRRTRDLWAGSFLLSYLSGQAMNAVIEAGGEILKPTVMSGQEIIDPLLKAINQKNLNEIPDKLKETPTESPILGTLPNQFKARVDKGFDANLCVKAIYNKWYEIAWLVWNRFVKDHATIHTEAIWKRQIDNFWEIAWVMADEPKEVGSENSVYDL